MGISFVKNCGIIKLSVKKANCIDNTEVKGCNAMKEITKETLLKAMKSRDAGEHPVFRECEFKDMDLSGMDLHNATSKEPTFMGLYWSMRSWMTFSQTKQRSGSACTVRRPDRSLAIRNV